MKTVLYIILICLISSAQGEEYKRSSFRHWIDIDRDCQNTRAEILIDHNIGVLKFKTKRKCVVVSGKWIDPYSGKMFFKARDLDIDHIIPLKYAYQLGAQNWSKAEKKEFANDPVNLLPVWNRLNRQKGARGPASWLPPKKDYQKEYIRRWSKLIEKYFKVSQ
ncbi:MAG: HNH endonuclease [Bacteriovoracaceae bacterium]|nr:HNH endonuclease [Bacteriovoracaceae bacterium]